MAYRDDVLALAPDHYWAMDAAAGNIPDEAGALALVPGAAAPDYQQIGAVAPALAVGFNVGPASGQRLGFVGVNLFQGSAAFSLSAWVKDVQYNDYGQICLRFYGDNGDYFDLQVTVNPSNDDPYQVRVYQWKSPHQRTLIATSTLANDGSWHHVAVVYDAPTLQLYLNGAPAGALDMAGVGLLDTAGELRLGGSTSTRDTEYLLDELAIWQSTALSLAQVQTLAAFAPPTIDVPMRLRGYLAIAGVDVPMRLRGQAEIAGVDVPMRLRAINPDYYAQTAARFSVGLALGGVDVSADLIGAVDIEVAENESGLADFVLRAPVGAIDPLAYVGKWVTIDYQRRDAADQLLASERRFTGQIASISYDPDLREITVAASNDLQGKVENLSRAQLAALIGGRWSAHVFEDAADPWQYAQERLLTAERELHVDQFGQLVAVPWFGLPMEGTWTDAVRFPERLALERVSRRDLITRVRVVMDFRYALLRHRELQVTVANSLGLCGWLAGEGDLIEKSVIMSAADGSVWTRVSPVYFFELPSESLAGICGGTNFAYNEGYAALCLGGTWRVARRWAQQINEVYTLDLIAPDLEAVYGVQAVTYRYGVEAAYDAGDYERSLDFDGPPAGAVLSPATNDYEVEADQAEQTGRAALAEAQRCALEYGRGLIRSRARRNTLPIELVYDASVTLRSVRSVDIDGLTTVGKIARIRERLDPSAAEESMQVVLAISRHDGPGAAVDSALDPAPAPSRPAEANTGRSYVVAHRSGGLAGAPADNEAWDGWMTNVNPNLQTDPTNLYRERLKLIIPEIEADVRDRREIEQSQLYICSVRNDDLIMVN